MDIMDTLRIKDRKPVEDDVENWDDDDFLIEADDLALRNPSLISANYPPLRRESLASQISMRSDRESVLPEEDQQVHLPNDDEKSTLNAIAIAANAGIPIPKDVPSSALQGTIKRLGGRKVKKILQEDWSDDLMFPDNTDALRIKIQDPARFPDVLRQVSSAHQSPPKLLEPAALIQGQTRSTKTPARVLAPPINLDRFRDTEEDEDLFGDGTETIKVSKTRQVSKPVLPKITTIKTPPPKEGGDDDFERDLELPSSGTLKLSSRRDIPKTPLSGNEDFDWGEGSLGTRYGGTRRDGRSNRSSSASAFSPSISSSITAESEDEAQLDGIELPNGPLDLRERLKRQRQNRSPERPIAEEPLLPSKSDSQDSEGADFFDDLDVGDGSVFGSGKLKLHTNVKLRDTRTTSPPRPKAAISLTFTNKPIQTSSRLPRPAQSHHERTLTQNSLEPVSESGGPIASRPSRRSQSRLGHMSQSSQSSTASNSTPITPSGSNFPTPSTPRKREVGPKTSSVSLRTEPTTTNAQLLRLKRSLPVLRSGVSPVRQNTARPPSRTDTATRPLSQLRPKTPVERARISMGESSAAQSRKPFLPAGASAVQSSHINTRGNRSLRRHDSDLTFDMRPTSRAVSRSTMRSPSPNKKRDRSEKLARAGVRLPLSLPKRPKLFGDGHELDAFDDLPTSAKTESEFVKQPKVVNNAQNPTQFRNKVMQHLLPGRTNSPAPSTPHSTLHSPARFDYQPRFARDTASSRIARETNLAHRVPSSGPLAPLTSQRVAQLSTRSNLHPLHPPQGTIRSKKLPRKPPQLKPHLIANLNPTKESKSEPPPGSSVKHELQD